MKELSQYFLTKKESGEKIFIPYIMAGANGLERLVDEMKMLSDSGVAAIELGIPFSDPVADGPIIQQAGLDALESGVTLKKIIKLLQDNRFSVPIILMGYLNSFYHYGLEQLATDLETTDVRGLIIPDLPYEHQEMVIEYFDSKNLSLIQLVTLTSQKERIRQLAKASEGFVYAVAVNGTTGIGKEYAEGLDEHLQFITEVSPLPVLVGFGVTTPEDANRFCRNVDGVIVGSKIVKMLSEKTLNDVGEFVLRMTSSLKGKS